MNKHHPYQNIIERKLEQLHTADADQLWDEMHSILDKKMPQKKERRRFIFWFFISNGFLLLALTIGVTLFFLPEKKNSAIAIKRSSSSKPGNFIADGVSNSSQGNKEKGTPSIESNKKSQDNRSTTTIHTNDNIADNDLIAEQTVRQSEKDKATEIYELSAPTISDKNAGSDVGSVDLKLTQQDLTKTKQEDSKESLNQQPDIKIDKVDPHRRKNNEKELYGGVVTGVDLSSIHLKSVRQGVTKGLIVGYALNKKWSIESGLLWDTKRVYDNGNYFNPPGYTPTNGIKITAVNGKSRLYEVPINIRYNIISGKNDLFATTGISSYIMRTENYDYQYTQNNQPGGHNYLSYTNETKNWFSVVNFSVGYTHKIDRIGNIRIEPYVKLPINNIGVGKMPIMSMGLNIGFTKTLK